MFSFLLDRTGITSWYGMFLYNFFLYNFLRKYQTLFLKNVFIYFQRGEGREKKKERKINVWLPLGCPTLGTWPTTQACDLTRNRTSDLLVCRLALNPLSHTSQGETLFQSGCTILHFHKQCMKVPIFPYFCLYVVLSVLLIIAILVGVLQHLIVVLICIS